MTNEEKIKALISARLASFLLARGACPSEIRISVEYPFTTAILRIEPAEINRIIEKEVTI